MTQRSKTAKRLRQRNLRAGEEELDILAAQDYEVQQFSEYHFRIARRIDVWPSAKKWYNGKTGEKGEYQNLVAFIKEKIG